MRKVMVAGFMFDRDMNRVALIRKNRPAHLAGGWNAIGGSVEAGERPDDAVRREFREETGVDHRYWGHFTTLTGPEIFPERGWEVWFFRARVDLLDQVRTVTDEEVRVFEVGKLPRNTLNNVRWLLPMAMWERPGRCYTVQEWL